MIDGETRILRHQENRVVEGMPPNEGAFLIDSATVRIVDATSNRAAM